MGFGTLAGRNLSLAGFSRDSIEITVRRQRCCKRPKSSRRTPFPTYIVRKTEGMSSSLFSQLIEFLS